MKRIHFRTRLRARVVPLAFIALSCAFALPWSDSVAQAIPPPTIDFHVIGSGGTALHNACFRLWGTVGQTAPGYSSASTYAVYAGFWSAAPKTGLDEIFFNGFEGC